MSKAKVIQVKAEPMEKNLSEAFQKLFKQKPVDVFKKRVSPKDVVAIKVNTLAGRKLSPRPLLVNLLTHWLIQAGVPSQHIIIFDRTDRELAQAGFKIQRGGRRVQCYGVNQGWDEEISTSGPVGSCFARIISQQATKLINIGVLKDHDLAGISGAMKNFYGCIHNPNKYHMNNCSPYVAHVANHPYIRGKLLFSLLDAPIGQYHGGPAYNPRYTFPANRILLSTDMVALDRIAWRIIEEERKKHQKPSLAEEKRLPQYILDGASLGLGIADTSKIVVL